MRVLVSGDRGWQHPELIREDLTGLQEQYGLQLVVIHGASGEADLAAHAACLDLGIDVIACPANWKGRKKSAGPFRNGLMFALMRPTLVLSYHRFLPNSKGTKDAVKKAFALGITVRHHDGERSELITEIPVYERTSV